MHERFIYNYYNYMYSKNTKKKFISRNVILFFFIYIIVI